MMTPKKKYILPDQHFGAPTGSTKRKAILAAGDVD
jgi:hypothetical protein